MKLTLPVFLVLGLLAGITPLAIDTYLPSIPTIAVSLNVPVHLVQMTLSMYLIVFAVLQILFGPISDAIGRRKVVVAGLSFFIVGSLFCAFSNSFNTLIIGRAIQAIGGAAVAVSIPALVKDSLSTDQFAKAMSMIILVMSIAPLVAPIVGGAILTLFNWHFIFIFLALIAATAIWLFLKTIPETLHKDNRSPLSFKSALSNYGVILRKPAVVGYILAGSFQFAGLMCFVTGSSFVYIELYGVEPSHFGFLFGLNIITMMIATTINNRFVEKVGIEYLVKYTVRVLFSATVAIIILTFFKHPPLAALVISCMLFTGCIGILGSGFMAGALKHSGKHNGSVAALAGTLRFSSGALSGVIVSLLDNGTFIPMLGTMAACGILCVITYQIVIRYFDSPEQEEAA
ncbi:Bicyclomycin resistance protein [Marinomonas spartinae]|uniref:Bcr/CflA family efflux transporter n=1 Tax=Marinomonas spartinae TaxID=1792290 RepID=A0A1A8TE18_9GAMM|nr:Bcr/CflA family multidrug efflux MFS transporter [Marinomonas spartinae]SBS30285.1 Bicyclomycin resistance protein [Marinomonas spartinae]SBS36784.1 Bicyclomycin resistance protein [Marinomonas spartinae]